MRKRFVVVPAVPTGKEYFPRRIGFPRALEAGSIFMIPKRKRG